ncbi:6011_t:CDS:1, partial [Cetraspora pellucida]
HTLCEFYGGKENLLRKGIKNSDAIYNLILLRRNNFNGAQGRNKKNSKIICNIK